MKLRLDDGTELFYTVDDFTDPWTEPQTVLMHHGMAKNHRMWFGWVPTIARHYRVIRFDMRGMGQSGVPDPGYPWSLDNFTNDLEEVVGKLGLDKFHLIGETVGGSISMNYSTRHQERLLSLTVCTSPTSFDSHHQESADLIDREGIEAWVDDSIGRRLDPDLVPPEYIRWYADQMKATPAHVVQGFQANAGGDLGPALRNVQTPVLVLAAASLREEVLGDFRGAAELFPNGRRVVFPGITGVCSAHSTDGLRPGLARLGAVTVACGFLGPQETARPPSQDRGDSVGRNVAEAAPRELDYNLIFLRLMSGRDPETGERWVWLDPGFAGAPLRFAIQAGVAALVMLAILTFVHSLSSAAIAAGLASSVVGMFVSPSNPTAKIRSVVGGHCVALVLGSVFSVILFLGPVETYLADRSVVLNLSLAVAVGLSMLLMATTNTEHPPAAGTAIGMATREFDILIFLSIIGAVVMLAVIKLALRPHLRDLT